MKRGVTVPPAIRAAFVAALAGESPHASALPDPLRFGGVTHVAPGLRVLVGRADEQWFLDYLLTNDDRDGPMFWHARIHESGTVESLENFEGQWGMPVTPDDPERTAAEHARIRTHNARVAGILTAKGFR